MHLQNLFEVIAFTLISNKKTSLDILWIGSRNEGRTEVLIPIEKFKKIALELWGNEWDLGNPNLIIVGEDWWIERVWNSEGDPSWKYFEIPKKGKYWDREMNPNWYRDSANYEFEIGGEQAKTLDEATIFQRDCGD